MLALSQSEATTIGRAAAAAYCNETCRDTIYQKALTMNPPLNPFMLEQLGPFRDSELQETAQQLLDKVGRYNQNLARPISVIGTDSSIPSMNWYPEMNWFINRKPSTSEEVSLMKNFARWLNELGFKVVLVRMYRDPWAFVASYFSEHYQRFFYDPAADPHTSFACYVEHGLDVYSKSWNNSMSIAREISGTEFHLISISGLKLKRTKALEFLVREIAGDPSFTAARKDRSVNKSPPIMGIDILNAIYRAGGVGEDTCAVRKSLGGTLDRGGVVSRTFARYEEELKTMVDCIDLELLLGSPVRRRIDELVRIEQGVRPNLVLHGFVNGSQHVKEGKQYCYPRNFSVAEIMTERILYELCEPATFSRIPAILRKTRPVLQSLYSWPPSLTCS
jgi:hypothetical protein